MFVEPLNLFKTGQQGQDSAGARWRGGEGRCKRDMDIETGRVNRLRASESRLSVLFMVHESNRRRHLLRALAQFAELRANNWNPIPGQSQYGFFFC